MSRTSRIFDKIVVTGNDALTLVNTTWDDMRTPLIAVGKGGLADPDWVKLKDNGAGSTGIYVYHFDSTTEQELFFATQTPHGWKTGTDLKPHIHWCGVSNGSAGQRVSWGLEYEIVGIGEVAGNTSIIYGNALTAPSGDTDIIAYKHYLTSLGTIDMSSYSDTVSVMIMGRVFRDAPGNGATDDYTADAAAFEIDFHHEIDGIGSKDQYSK